MVAFALMFSAVFLGLMALREAGATTTNSTSAAPGPAAYAAAGACNTTSPARLERRVCARRHCALGGDSAARAI
ncbi:hypothetical protein AB1N83_001240 [Pleurotus pulmonarius]